MALSTAVVFFGILAAIVAQVSAEISLGDDELPPELLAFANIFESMIACLDGNCDLDKSLTPKIEVTAAPVTQKPTAAPVTTPKVTVAPVKPDVTSPYLGLCTKFFAKKDLLMKNPEFKDFETKLMSYVKEILLKFLKNPDKKNEVILHILDELIEKLIKLKTVFQKKSVKTTPIPSTVSPTEEIIAEELDDSRLVGSIRGVPGIHYPNYTEVPITSFSCGGKKYIPGFYADEETRCQVFHVCYEHRRESFLCPVGTTFNQPILACDYWYSSNCSLSSHYYDVNAKKIEVKVPEKSKHDIKEIITTIIEQEKPVFPTIKVKSKETSFFKNELEQLLKFLPIKAKILEFPKKSVVPIVKPFPVLDPKVVKAVPLKVGATIPVKVGATKAKIAAATIPIKAKAAAVPVVKAKVAAAASVPLFKAMAAIPIAKALPVKAKAAYVPIFKAAAQVPFVKAAVMKPKLAVVPLKMKSAMVTAPVFKTKAAMISPLTKKALALGYVKLLKAKKLALMG